MSEPQEFIDFLRAHPGRRNLAKHLQADVDRVCCYYLCPGATMPLVADSGIKCRNADKALSVDLSSPVVQRRRRTVWLGRWTGQRWDHKRDYPVHSCVNLFWNPCNSTFEAFQRNALLVGDSVCVLELDAEPLITGGFFWTATSRNAAAGPFAGYRIDKLRDPGKFAWDRVFSFGDDRQDERAAELLVFDPVAGEHSGPVDRRLVRRVIAPHGADVRMHGWTVQCLDIYKPIERLLKAEEKFVETLARCETEVAERIAAAFRALLNFEDRFGRLSEPMFSVPGVAHGNHGIGHVVRVMFWSAFLSTYSHGMDPSDEQAACIMGAMLHDLTRPDDSADAMHGVSLREDHLRLASMLAPSGLTTSCLAAVKNHSKEDDQCPPEERDGTWAILKDADGLERARFAPPQDKARPDGAAPEGQWVGACYTGFLRMPEIRRSPDGKARVPWLAFWLARITKFTRWGDAPCRDLFRALVESVRCAVKHGVLRPDSEGTAGSLLQRLLDVSE